MFPSHSPQQAAIAGQLAQELAGYERGLRGLVRGVWQPAEYRRLADQFDRIQMHAGMLPRLTGCWSELLISRLELTHALWTAGAPGRGDAEVLARHARHCALIAEVQRGCAVYMPASAH